MTVSDTRTAPFGRVLTAMVTPFRDDLSVDLDACQRLAAYLVEHGSDGLVVNGTTGESPTTTDHEQQQVVHAVVEAVGERATVVAGASSNDTLHAIERGRLAEKAGAHGLLVVSPYYNKPPQAGVLQHVTMVAEAIDLPVMLFDIPGRTGVAIDEETMVRAAEHERILAVKDAKGDLEASSWVMRRTDLAWYSGDDVMTLPILSIGGVGVVSVASHLVGVRIHEMVDAYDAGQVHRAQQMHRSLLPVFTGVFRTPGVMSAKAALAHLGVISAHVRTPLVELTANEWATLQRDLRESEVEGFSA